MFLRASLQCRTLLLFRVDQLVAAMARTRLAGSTHTLRRHDAYVQALRAAAEDGVDVRLLVPGMTDIAVLPGCARSASGS